MGGGKREKGREERWGLGRKLGAGVLVHTSNYTGRGPEPGPLAPPDVPPVVRLLLILLSIRGLKYLALLCALWDININAMTFN